MSEDCVIVFEDEHYEGFYPISISHPVFDILIGTKTNLDRIRNHFKEYTVTKMCRPYLSNLVDGLKDDAIKDLSQCRFRRLILINGRVVLRKRDSDFINALKGEDDCVSYAQNGTLVAATLPSEFIKRFSEGLLSLSRNGACQGIIDKTRKAQQVDVLAFSHIWEPMLENPNIIKSDFEEYYKDSISRNKVGESYTYDRDRIFVDENIAADFASVIDARNGPVIIEKDVEIKPLTYLEGPAFIGEGCKLVGGKVTDGCSFGSGCRIGGELQNAIILGHSNKYHEGFIGHSYIGEWVNLGALTTNSDLANDYSNISIRQNGTHVNTGSMKIGSFIGDHTKIGIGMTLNTGSVIGFSCNLFGGSWIKEKEIPSFAWGNDSLRSRVSLSRAIETAKIVLDRRKCKFNNGHKQLFEHVYDQSKSYRKTWIEKGRHSTQNRVG